MQVLKLSFGSLAWLFLFLTPSSATAAPLSVVGDSIEIFNGNNYQSQIDFAFPTLHKRGLVFERSYNSRGWQKSGPLGYGWSHTFQLTLNPDFMWERKKHLRIVDETGRGVYFTPSGAGHYVGAFKERTKVELEEGNCVWYRLDGSRFIFDKRNLLIQIDDNVGNRQHFSYDENNRLQAIADSATDFVLNFFYGADGMLRYLSGKWPPGGPDILWAYYAYDEHQNLVSVKYPDGSGFRYAYTDPKDVHKMTEKRDINGKFLASWEYDDQGRAIKNVTHDNKGVTIEYVNEREVKVTNSKGIARTYGIGISEGRKIVLYIDVPPGVKRAGGEIRALSYDKNLRVTEARYVNGCVSQYRDFDSRGKPQTIKYLTETRDERLFKYTYHPRINAKLSTQELAEDGSVKSETIWDYDDDGNDVPNENPTGQLRRRIVRGFKENESGNKVPYEEIIDYTYTTLGQLVAVDKPGMSQAVQNEPNLVPNLIH